jgi:hypothetical protein
VLAPCWEQELQRIPWAEADSREASLARRAWLPDETHGSRALLLLLLLLLSCHSWLAGKACRTTDRKQLGQSVCVEGQLQAA